MAREQSPRLAVFLQIAGDAGDGVVKAAMHRNDPAAGKDLRVIDLRPQQFEAVLGETQLLRHGREICELKPAGVHVRAEARERDLLGRRHAADCVVLVEHERL
jgi:hypothetical protein